MKFDDESWRFKPQIYQGMILGKLYSQEKSASALNEPQKCLNLSIFWQNFENFEKFQNFSELIRECSQCFRERLQCRKLVPKWKFMKIWKIFDFFKICNFVKIESKMNDFLLKAEVLFSKFGSSASPSGGNLVDGLPPALGIFNFHEICFVCVSGAQHFSHVVQSWRLEEWTIDMQRSRIKKSSCFRILKFGAQHFPVSFPGKPFGHNFRFNTNVLI